MPSDHLTATAKERETSARRCLVLGIGNPLMGDDGVGIRALEDLGVPPPPQVDIEILDGGTLGFALADRVAGADALIVLDAANLGQMPGTVQVFVGQAMDDFLAGNRAASVHEAGLVDLVQMLAWIGELPVRRALVGIQPAVIGWGTELSPELARSLPQAREAVRALVSEWYGTAPGRA